MTEPSCKTIILDFSKMKPEDYEKAKGFIGSIISDISPNALEAVKDYNKQKLENTVTVDKVISSIVNVYNNYLGRKCTREELLAFVKTLNLFAPGALTSLIMRIIAVALDRRHDNHISDNKEVYMLNFLNGKIQAVPANEINKKAWKYFAAFRTSEEAVFGIKLTQAVKDALLQ